MGFAHRKYSVNLYKQLEWMKLLHSQWYLHLGFAVEYKSLKLEPVAVFIPVPGVQAHTQAQREFARTWTYPKLVGDYIDKSLDRIEFSFLRIKFYF